MDWIKDLNKAIRFIEDNILTANLEQLFTGIDVVIHLAAITDATNSFAIRTTGGGTVLNPFTGGDKTWGSFGNCYGGGAWGDCNGNTQNVVRYDSPTFGGFSVSASWGEDDMWDVAARYAGEWSGFKLAAAAAYNEVNSSGTCAAAVSGVPGCGGYNNLGALEAQYFQAGAFLMHVPTGLFAYGAYGNMQNDTVADLSDSETWYGKVGLRSRFSALGHTVFYGEYLNADGNGETQVTDINGDDVAGSIVSLDGLEVWGGGIVQEVDAAAMSVWVKYRHLSADSTTLEGPAVGIEDFQYVGVGGLINF
jgi:hypothetical protein